MYKKILLAYDGTTCSSAAVRQSVELAYHCKAELHLLGVVAVTSTSASANAAVAGVAISGAYPLTNEIWARDQQFLKEALDTAAQDIGRQGLGVETSIRFGSPGLEIAACAHDIKADLIVIGHTGKGVLARMFEGSVGTELLNNLPCSLLVATGET